MLDALIAATPFDLPPDLVSRQEKSTISRLIMELRQEGFSDSDIRAREAEIRANAHEMTLRSLKEFFILAKDRRGRGDQGRGGGPRAGDRGAGRANRRERAADPRACREGRAGRSPGRPDPGTARPSIIFSDRSRSRTCRSTSQRRPSRPSDQTATPAEARESEADGRMRLAPILAEAGCPGRIGGICR